MKSFDQAAFAEAERLIAAGAFREAVGFHRSLFPRQRDPLFHELSEDDLRECIETPLPVFYFCSPAQLSDLRRRMATALVVEDWASMGGCSGYHPMSAAAVKQNFWASVPNYRSVSEWKRSGLVLRARILNSCDGGCEECQAAAREYDLEDLPAVPILTCRNLNRVGCRCFAVASAIKGVSF